MAIIGITVVVMTLGLVINLRCATISKKDAEYRMKEEQLMAQKQEEEERAASLEERRIYVQTKQYIEEVAKEKLGLVNPGEILLKPSE